jgi:type IV pilus assembly protein PilE
MRNPQRGFTLIELVVAVAVLGILTAIAIPQYISYTLKSHRTDAIRSLTSIRQALERCYSQNFTYLNGGSTPCPAANGSATTSSNGYYNITYTTLTATKYTLQAAATGLQLKDTNCATFTMDNTGAQTALNSGNTDNSQACWGSK